MKVRIALTKQGRTICQLNREVADSESFAAACTEVWQELERRGLEATTSVGECMDRVNEAALDQLDGAQLSFARV